MELLSLVGTHRPGVPPLPNYVTAFVKGKDEIGEIDKEISKCEEVTGERSTVNFVGLRLSGRGLAFRALHFDGWTSLHTRRLLCP